MLTVLARLNNTLISKVNVLFLWFGGTPRAGKRSDKVMHLLSLPTAEPITDLLARSSQLMMEV
jgi:hypothetical protein